MLVTLEFSSKFEKHFKKVLSLYRAIKPAYCKLWGVTKQPYYKPWGVTKQA